MACFCSLLEIKTVRRIVQLRTGPNPCADLNFRFLVILINTHFIERLPCDSNPSTRSVSSILKTGASILWEREAQRRITSCSLREYVKGEVRAPVGVPREKVKQPDVKLVFNVAEIVWESPPE